MVEAMLDVMLGRWWRGAIDGFQGHFWLAVVPMVVWMSVMITGNRVVKDAERAMRSELAGWSKARRAGPNLLEDRLVPVIRRTAERHRWMPAAHGLWMRRCDPEAVVSHMTRMPNYFVRFRDQSLHISTVAPRRGGRRQRRRVT